MTKRLLIVTSFILGICLLGACSPEATIDSDSEAIWIRIGDSYYDDDPLLREALEKALIEPFWYGTGLTSLMTQEEINDLDKSYRLVPLYELNAENRQGRKDIMMAIKEGES